MAYDWLQSWHCILGFIQVRDLGYWTTFSLKSVSIATKNPCAKTVSSANYYNLKISNTLVSKSANHICICIIQVWRVLPRAGWKWGTSMKESSSSLLSLVTLPPGSSRAGTEPSGSAGCDVLAREGGDCLLPAPFRATCTHSASPVNHNQPSVKLSTSPNFQVKIICIKLKYNNDPLQS